MDCVSTVLYIFFCLTVIVLISIQLTKGKIDAFTTVLKAKQSKIGEIDILGTSKFSPECCPHTYTSSSGCLCDTQNENTIIKSRGGNKCCC